MELKECLQAAGILSIVFKEVTRASAQKNAKGLLEKSSELMCVINGRDLIRLQRADGLAPIALIFKCFITAHFFSPFLHRSTRIWVRNVSSASPIPEF